MSQQDNVPAAANMRPLLARISAIVFKYEKFAEITGERFNIFTILGLESSEVRTHSSFLAEMLNPKGAHGMGKLPLQKFLEIVGIENFPTESANVASEVHIGTINETKTAGGRIDILIKSADERAMIAIENKINAGDQENQLLRYYNYLEYKKANRGLIYLTLAGSVADEKSTGSALNVKYIPKSYAIDILEWLAVVHKESANKPIVRESLMQYMNLVKKLTNKTENEEMAEEIAVELTKDNEKLNTFFSIYDSCDAVYKKVAEKNRDAWQTIAADRGLTPEISMHSGKGAGIYFSNAELKSRNLHIGFEADGKELGKFFFGIFDGGKLETAKRMQIKNLFEQAFGSTQDAGSWPAYQYFPDHQSGRELLKVLNSADAAAFNKSIAEKVDLMLKIVFEVN